MMPWRPNWATHPGEHLAEYLAVKGWRQADLSRATGLTKKTICLIISGQNPITANTALRLAKVLPLKAEIWMALQANYDLHQARKK